MSFVKICLGLSLVCTALNLLTLANHKRKEEPPQVVSCYTLYGGFSSSTVCYYPTK